MWTPDRLLLLRLGRSGQAKEARDLCELVRRGNGIEELNSSREIR
ncbi:uncharacterized protein RAG0_02371 [Rhynchosporium agropyri]|uniref:Uncharacterized protein n=2 Tax=Rhynchosporium TaxID=38037 RepID=A0A1E1MF92_RHYSE|nr:uncharacterized protein RAG0_02371 [Rhynchosporium agropyri]CZT47697.1 uncharacterized protein RSE6_08290 [Rhynchosporium secalis]